MEAQYAHGFAQVGAVINTSFYANPNIQLRRVMGNEFGCQLEVKE
jgi:hypothetical protein